MGGESASVLHRVWARLRLFKPAEWDPPLDTLPNMKDRLIDVGLLLRGSAASDQKQSLFFTRLPLEIRCHIYSFVLPEEKRVWVRPSPHRKCTRSNDGGTAAVIDHFPCTTPPLDLTWTAPRKRGHCVGERHTGFFDKVKAHRTQPHMDTLLLMKTCQRVCLELYDICTFCFDNTDTFYDFINLCPTLPIRHLQVRTYEEKMVFSWQQELAKLNAACRRVPGLASLLVTLHPTFFYVLRNPDQVLASLRVIDAPPILRAEIL
ncbi:hypothetical protein QBC34DRAFT_324511, partial [Podospora aff. communis PSN243]